MPQQCTGLRTAFTRVVTGISRISGLRQGDHAHRPCRETIGSLNFMDAQALQAGVILREHTVSARDENYLDSVGRKSKGELFLLVVISTAAALLSPALALGYGLWAPAAIIWETFGVHYTALPTLLMNYHFIGNAMAFAVLYAYGPSAIVHFLMEGSPFTRMQIYLALVYVVHALLIGACGAWTARRQISGKSKLIILLVVAILPLWAASRYSNILTVNYYWLSFVLYTVAAGAWVEAINGTLRIGDRTAGLFGAACSFAMWTKFSYLLTICPFFALLLWLVPARRIRATIIAAATYGITTICVAVIYFVGHLDYVYRFASDLPGMYSSDFLIVSYPLLRAELTDWVRWDSGLQLVAILLVAATTLGGFHAWRSKCGPAAWLFLTATSAVALIYIDMLFERNSINTFADAIAFSMFVIGTWASVLRSKIASVALAAGCVLIAIIQVAVMDIPRWLEKVRLAGKSAMEVQADIDSRRPLPVVYYWSRADLRLGGRDRTDIWHGDALWASPFLYALVSGRQETKYKYLSRFFPDSSVRGLRDGLAPFDHVAVIQEYLKRGDPLFVQQFGVKRELDSMASHEKNHCVRHQVTAAWTDHVYDEPTFITVCSVTTGHTLDYSWTIQGVTVDMMRHQATGLEIGSVQFANVTTVIGGSGNDTFIGGPGSHTFNGGGGVNTFDYSAAPAAVTIDLGTGTASNGYGGTDILISIERLIGSAFNDTFLLGHGNYTLIGGGGVDTAKFVGAASQYTVLSEFRGDGTVYVGNSAEGLDKLTGIALLEFSDSTVNSLMAASSGLEYIASYGDLIHAFGADEHAGITHYIDRGFKEGRKVTFNALDYIASYGDLIKAFGTNEQAGTTHYITHGFNEGRTPNLFDPEAYLAKYPDLRAAFGHDHHAATVHWIKRGFYEGRD
jgi:hypothetical protein